MRLKLILCCAFMLAAGPLFAADLPVAGKVCVINLSDDHCMPCKMMDRLLDRMRVEYRGEVLTSTVNALKERGVSARYAPQTLPTLIFFNRRGEEALRHAGLMEEAALRSVIDKLLAE